MSRVQIKYKGQQTVIRDDVVDVAISEDHETMILTYEDDSTEELETSFVHPRKRPMPAVAIARRRKPS